MASQIGAQITPQKHTVGLLTQSGSTPPLLLHHAPHGREFMATPETWNPSSFSGSRLWMCRILLILLRRFYWFLCKIGNAAQCVAKIPAWHTKTNVHVFEQVHGLTDCPKRLRSSAVTIAHGSVNTDVFTLPSATTASQKHSTNSRDTRYEPCDLANAWQKTSGGFL